MTGGAGSIEVHYDSRLLRNTSIKLKARLFRIAVNLTSLALTPDVTPQHLSHSRWLLIDWRSDIIAYWRV
jgi:hypothetical protein